MFLHTKTERHDAQSHVVSWQKPWGQKKNITRQNINTDRKWPGVFPSFFFYFVVIQVQFPDVAYGDTGSQQHQSTTRLLGLQNTGHEKTSSSFFFLHDVTTLRRRERWQSCISSSGLYQTVCPPSNQNKTNFVSVHIYHQYNELETQYFMTKQLSGLFF